MHTLFAVVLTGSIPPLLLSYSRYYCPVPTLLTSHSPSLSSLFIVGTTSCLRKMTGDSGGDRKQQIMQQKSMHQRQSTTLDWQPFRSH